MGGGSLPGPSPRRPGELQTLLRQTQLSAERERLDSSINDLLYRLLAKMKQRDPGKVQEYLDEVERILGTDETIERLLFGGSVARHTYVDGLSDVDALVILDRAELLGKSPRVVLNTFHRSLRDRLTYDAIQSVAKGRMAVTITYRDGIEIQLLPARRSGATVSVPSLAGKAWNETTPKVFQRALSSANERLNGSLVPTIKLIKSIKHGLPKLKQLRGYHIENLALEAAKGYRGPRTVKAVLTHVLDRAATAVGRPIGDMTGQSKTVDSYLGRANSPKRRAISDALAGVARDLNAATSVAQWERIIGA